MRKELSTGNMGRVAFANKLRRPIWIFPSASCIFYNCATFAIGNGGNGKFDIRSS